MKFISLLTLLLLLSCSSSGELNEDAKKVGNYLISASINGSIKSIGSTKHPNIINLGSSLKSKLLSLNEGFNSSCYTQVISGDSNVGDNTASHHIYIICDEQKKIGIRLKFNEGSNAFHILGFWTTSL